MIFDKTPAEITEVRRIRYEEAAAAGGGSGKESYDRFFIKDHCGTNALTNAKVREIAGGAAAKEQFGLDPAVNDSKTNGAGNNRNVAPTGITFDSAEKAVPGGNLDVGDAIGVWPDFRYSAVILV